MKMLIIMVTWLHLRTHHLWRTIKEVGLLSEDHLPQCSSSNTGETLQEAYSMCLKATMSTLHQPEFIHKPNGPINHMRNPECSDP